MRGFLRVFLICPDTTYRTPLLILGPIEVAAEHKLDGRTCARASAVSLIHIPSFSALSVNSNNAEKVPLLFHSSFAWMCCNNIPISSHSHL